MVTFRSSTLLFTTALIFMAAIFMFYMASISLWYEGENTEVAVGSIVMYVLSGLFFWILFDTKYTIKNSFLFYYSGPVRGKIAIDSIRKIKHQKGWVSESFLKPALGINGLYIYYNKYDDIYISPKDKEAFVNYLLKINPKIEII